MSITQEKMSAAQEASGMKTSNFTANMSTYYFAIAVFVGGLIGLFIITRPFMKAILKNEIQDRIKAKYEGIKKKFFFNG